MRMLLSRISDGGSNVGEEDFSAHWRMYGNLGADCMVQYVLRTFLMTGLGLELKVVTFYIVMYVNMKWEHALNSKILKINKHKLKKIVKFYCLNLSLENVFVPGRLKFHLCGIKVTMCNFYLMVFYFITRFVMY